MNKRDLKLLEKVFECDIEPVRLFQSKSKNYPRLEQEGYVEKVSYTIPGRPFPVHVEGWTLTILGNFTVCASYAEEVEDVPQA